MNARKCRVLVFLSIDLVSQSLHNLLLHILLVEVLDVGLDELEGVSHLGHLSDLGVIGLVVSVENVLLDGRVEEQRLLHHDADLFAELPHIVLADVYSVNEELSAGEVIESQKQVGHGALAAAGVADQSDLHRGRDL